MSLRSCFRLVCACAATLLSTTVDAAEYRVGPGHAYATPSEVPWEALQAGDIVLIHWRSTPYKDKWVIGRQGTASAPIVVRGVPNAEGERPMIDGDGAVTRLALHYWGEARAVIKIGGSSIPGDTMPRYVVVENLDVRGAHPNYGFTDHGGARQVYDGNAAAIWIEKGEHIVLRNNRIHDSANGIFVSSWGELVSRNITVEGNDIFDNGLVGSFHTHNTYTEALEMTYQFNRFGPLRAGASGNNLKDRSAGLVVRYNWIEGGNRQLDLVESATGQILASPAYQQTFVYGNILIEPAAAGNQQIVHFGGDGGDSSLYRNGDLYFYNNTVVSYRPDRTTLFRLSTNNEHADARNNIFYTALADGSSLSLTDGAGALDMANNWLKPGYVKVFGALSGVVNEASLVLGVSPGFAAESTQDFRLASGSAARDAGTPIAAIASGTHDVTYQYVKHGSGALRPVDAVLDIGAYEVGASNPTAPTSPSSSATYVRTDGVTKGDWIGNYGSDGFAIAGDSTRLPPYAQLTLAGHGEWTWAPSTGDVRALQRSSGVGRVAATWYGTTFTVDVEVTDGQVHQVAIYSVDWDSPARVQTIQVLDVTTGSVLDTRTMRGFSGGQYIVWDIGGHVAFRVIHEGGVNAVVSGVFFGAGNGGSPVPPEPVPQPGSAAFIGSDATTQGTWQGVYGAEGYSLAADATKLPTDTLISVANATVVTWDKSTQDLRALQRGRRPGRIAAAWTGATFTVDVAGPAEQKRQLAVYCVDWLGTSPLQRFDVLDAATGTILDSRSVSDFAGGRYVVWEVGGRVVLRVAGDSGANAVVSGIFIR